ncbi:MAG: hypothetical protein LV481_09175 [Methylacidiphilales bacterium]|nr:hypothetical protein [Candidatus Methylacidiphilales bacterium]
MIFLSKWKPNVRGLALVTGVAILTACAAPPDDLTNSRLTQPPAGTPVPPPAEAGDIAIAGQYAAHAIMDLPEVANATVPPLVQFTGVTSIIVSQVPIDTEPYTVLLRDRLLLITREKLRFVERELPPLEVTTSKKSKKKKAAPASEASENPDYQVLAELHGRYKDDFYKVQIQFVDIHTGAVLFNGLYRIGKEIPPADDTSPAPSDTAVPPPVDNNAPSTPTVQDPSQSSATGMTQ